MFEPMPYLEWIHGRPEAAAHDLGSSDLRTHEHDRSVVPATLAGLSEPENPALLAQSLAEEYDVSESEVLVTAGATHANFLAVSTALSLAAGTEVLVEEPGYDPLVHTPSGVGGRVKRFERTSRVGHPLLPGDITSAVTDQTALVTVTNRLDIHLRRDGQRVRWGYCSGAAKHGRNRVVH